ncbi:MAG TPA: radical SAM protein [Polyangia bacterium]|jgi:pyruvate-formate lyase-activating enzyme
MPPAGRPGPEGAPEPGAGPDGRPLELAGIHDPTAYPGTAVLVLLVAGCDLRCVFCRAPQPWAPRPPTTAEALALLDGTRRRARLVITGGEPTARPDLLELCAAARRRGFRAVQLQTHGGRLAEPGLAAALAAAGVSALDVPLYAARPAAHDGITGVPGSHARTLAGIARARAAGLDVAVHTTLFAGTVAELPALLRLVAAHGVRRAAVEPVGLIDDLDAYARETPRLAAVGAALAAGVPPRLTVRLANVPPCAVPAALRRRRPTLLRTPAAWRAGAVPAGYAEVLAAITRGRSRAYAAACARCRLRPGCAGVAAEYLRAFGDAALPAGAA